MVAKNCGWHTCPVWSVIKEGGNCGRFSHEILRLGLLFWRNDPVGLLDVFWQCASELPAQMPIAVGQNSFRNFLPSSHHFHIDLPAEEHPCIHQGTLECCKGFWGVHLMDIHFFHPRHWVSLLIFNATEIPVLNYHMPLQGGIDSGVQAVFQGSLCTITNHLIVNFQWLDWPRNLGKWSLLSLLALTLHKNVEQQ